MSLITTAVCRLRQAMTRRSRRRNRPVRPAAEEGAGSVFSVAQILRAGRMKKPMVIVGAGMGPWADRIVHALQESDMTYVLWDELSAHPTTEDGESIRSRWLAEECDSFVAVGDSAALDLAKAAAARAACRGRTIMNMVGVDKVRRKLPPVVAIPAVAGGGAEALSWAEVEDERGSRFVLEDPALVPPYVVQDPELLESMSRPALAAAAADGLCLAVEAYLSGYGDDSVRAEAAAALRGFFAAVEPCWNNGGTVEQRSVLLSASRGAGEAASLAGAGYVRALTRAVTTVCGLDRGETCAAILPAVLENYGNHAVRRLAVLAEQTGVAPEGGTAAEKAAALIRRIRQLTFRIGLPDTAEAIPAEDIGEIADLAAAEANPRWACPVVWSTADLMDVLKTACAVREL